MNKNMKAMNKDAGAAAGNMLQELWVESQLTRTENGALTYASTGKDCLDLFASIGAMRNSSDDEIRVRFMRAFAENPDVAMKTLFFARDVRGGLGERHVFRVILEQLAHSHSDSVKKNLRYIAEYGRWDDLLCLLETPCEEAALALIREQLLEDMAADADGGNVSLLAKWLPSVNTSNKETVLRGKRIARALGMRDAEYRKMLARLRSRIAILENNLREKDYTFDYEKQPSKAMLKYRAAFHRNDGKRYTEYLNAVREGKAVMHTGTLAPYEIIHPFFQGYGLLYGEKPSVPEAENEALETAWGALEDFTGDEDALVVMDGSGSMYYGHTGVKPITVAMSLAMYFAERNKGAYKGHFITFSETPKLVKIKGSSLLDRVRYCASFCEVANTDLMAVFRLILNAAVKNHLPQSDMPKKLYIVSDMEFDGCLEHADSTNFAAAKKMFEEAGYALPQIVFWNVESRHGHQPVRYDEKGVALVSGCTPRLFSMMMSGDINPYKMMIETLSAERYAPICA